MSSEKPPEKPNGPSDNRRTSARLGLSAVTRFWHRDQEFVGTTRLINLGGLLLEATEALPLGSQVRVQLNLPTSLEPFEAHGKVVYRHNIRGRKSHQACEMGIKFLNCVDKSEKQLNDFTQRYKEFNTKHSVFSKEMTTFDDPTIIETPPESSGKDRT